MLDKQTGAIKITESCVIKPQMTKADFAAWWESDPCRVLHAQGDSAYQGRSYRARFADPRRRELIMTVSLLDDRLYLVGLFYLLPQEDQPGSPTAQWMDENEQQRQHLHDAILHDWLGEPPYDYSWGRVASVYDSRSGFSEIRVTYNT